MHIMLTKHKICNNYHSSSAGIMLGRPQVVCTTESLTPSNIHFSVVKTAAEKTLQICNIQKLTWL